MAREYRHLKVYEKEILELREQGLTQREIAQDGRNAETTGSTCKTTTKKINTNVKII